MLRAKAPNLACGMPDSGRFSAAIIAITAIACSGNLIETRQATHADYWGALAELRPEAATKVARTFSQKLFAESLRYMIDGEMDRAEVGFASLQATADDSLLRSGARVAYSAVLQYEEKWDILALVPPSVSPDRDADRAGVERWAAVFKNVPAKTIAFSSRLVVLPLTLSAIRTPIIPVRINGHDYHFWLDTGSSLTIISSGVAAALRIAPISTDTLEMVTATGRVKALPAMIAKLELGEISVQDANAMIVDEKLMEMRESKRGEGFADGPRKIDGIVGYDIIHRLDVEIDYEESRVRLRDPTVRRGDRSSRNLFWLGVPVVRLLAGDGTPLHFGLDTGAGETFGTETLLDKLELQPNRRDARSVGGLAGVASLQAPVVHVLRLTVRDRPLFLRELVIYAPVYRTLVSLDGVLGSDVSRVGIVRLDATNGVYSVDEGIRKPLRPVF
jgi:hypothetical protein